MSPSHSCPDLSRSHHSSLRVLPEPSQSHSPHCLSSDLSGWVGVEGWLRGGRGGWVRGWEGDERELGELGRTTGSYSSSRNRVGASLSNLVKECGWKKSGKWQWPLVFKWDAEGQSSRRYPLRPHKFQYIYKYFTLLYNTFKYLTIHDGTLQYRTWQIPSNTLQYCTAPCP